MKLQNVQPPPERNEGGVLGHRSPQKIALNWRLKTRQEYLAYLTEKERGKYEKLDQPPNRYFKRKKLADIVSLHGHYLQGQDKELLRVFNHFLKGKYSLHG